MPGPYLVLFVADRAGDHHAAALREVARGVPDAGFFDDGMDGPDLGAERTVGTYVPAAAIGDGLALLAAVARLSAELEARIEVQHDERILGFLETGRPDAALRAELGPLGDIPEPL